MRVCIAHSEYRETGGEEGVVSHERDLLSRAGVRVSSLTLKTSALDKMSVAEKARFVREYPAHDFGARALVDLEEREGPFDVVHFHNVFPMLGYGAVEEARERNAAIVLTLHNYRLSCLAGTHLYRGRLCERCTPAAYRPGIVRACYRDSRGQSYLAARGARRLWRAAQTGSIDRVIALTPAQREYYVDAGLPSDRVVVKPNSIELPRSAFPREERSGMLYAGRLSAEKGMHGLLQAWPDDGPRLDVYGDGPDAQRLRALTGDRVVFGGHVDHGEIRERIARAVGLVVPSLWFEGLPMTIVEALSAGTPVICFDVIKAAPIVASISPLLVLETGRFEAMAERSKWLCGLSPREYESLSSASRDVAQRRFSDEASTQSLLGLYEDVSRTRRGETGAVR